MQDAGRSWAGWLASEAAARNPRVKIFVSPVTWPAWLRGAPGGGGADDPFDTPDVAASYVASFVALFQTRWAVSVGFVGVWASPRSNVSSSADPRQRAYVLALRAALDARALQATQIVCSDGGSWGCAELLDPAGAAFDAQVSAAVGVLGNAGRPAPAQLNASANNAARPVWVTSYNSTWTSGPQPAINSGALSVSNEVLEAFVNSGGLALSGFVFSLGVTAVAYGYPTWATGLVQATQPWSGHFFPTVPLWAVAHVNQFVAPGAGGGAGSVWRALPVGAGSGRLAGGGLYMCFVETALGLSDWACVIQKYSDWDENGDRSNVGTSQAAIVDEVAAFTLAPSLRVPAAGAEVWRTTFGIYRPEQNVSLFLRQRNAAVDAATRTFSLALSGTSIYTVTSATPSGAAQGCVAEACEALPPPPASFGARTMTFAPDECTAGAPGTFLTSIFGSFECVADAALGGVLRQTAVGVAAGDALGNVTVPHALTGDLDTTDVDVSVDVFFDESGGGGGGGGGGGSVAALLGAHVSPWTAIKRGAAAPLAFAQAPGIWLSATVAPGGGLNWSLALGLDATSLASPALAGVAPGSYAGRWLTLRIVVRSGRVVASAGGAVLYAGASLSGAPATGYIGVATSAFAAGPAFRNLAVASAATTCDAVPRAGAAVDVEICQAGAAGQSFAFSPTGEYNASATYYRRLIGIDALGADTGIAMPGSLDTDYAAWRAACDADATPGSPPGTFCHGFSSSGLAKLNLDDIAPAAAGPDGAPLTDLFLKTLPAGQLRLASNTSLCLDATPGALNLFLNVCDDPARGPVFGTQMWGVEKTLTDGSVVYGVLTSGRAGPFAGAGVADISGLVNLDVEARVMVQVQGYNGGSNELFDHDPRTGLLRASHMGVCLGACAAL